MIVAMIWYRPFSRPDFGFDDRGSAPNGLRDDLVHHVILAGGQLDALRPAHQADGDLRAAIVSLWIKIRDKQVFQELLWL